mmetsp:Transcript_11378/g.38866  ORF Transcript_11378/g.38866 Transcript_11378/m.38866 type:complete len:304 (-) Transcript_11378:96-1007(-)
MYLALALLKHLDVLVKLLPPAHDLQARGMRKVRYFRCMKTKILIQYLCYEPSVDSSLGFNSLDDSDTGLRYTSKMTNSEAKLDMDLADVVKADKKDEMKSKKSPKAKTTGVKVGTKKGVKTTIKKDPALLKAQQAAKKVRQQRQAQLGQKATKTPRQQLRKNTSTSLQGAVSARRNQQTKQRVANTAQARKNKIASNRGLANNQNNAVRRNNNQRQQPFVFRGNNKGYNNYRSNQQYRGNSNAIPRGGMRVVVVNNRGNRRGQQRVPQPTVRVHPPLGLELTQRQRMQQQVQQQRQRVQQVKP